MKKQILSVLASGALVVSAAMPVFAENTNTAYFFLHEYNQVRQEDGTTIAYPSSEYLPKNSNHKAISGQILTTATGSAIDETLAEKLDKGESLNETEEASLKTNFSAVEESLGENAPSLQNNSTLKQIVLDNYAVTEDEISDGTVKVLWYVVKTGAAIANDGCGYHVDGIIYNVKTGKVTSAIEKYSYTVKTNYYTQTDDNEPVLDGSESSEEYYVSSNKEITVGVPAESIYKDNTYSIDGDSKKSIAPTSDGLEVEFNYIRYVKTPIPEPEKDPTPEPEPIEPDVSGDAEPDVSGDAKQEEPTIPEEKEDDGIGEAEESKEIKTSNEVTEAVDTADSSNVAMWIGAAVIAILGAIVIFIQRKDQ